MGDIDNDDLGDVGGDTGSGETLGEKEPALPGDAVDDLKLSSQTLENDNLSVSLKSEELHSSERIKSIPKDNFSFVAISENFLNYGLLRCKW